MEKCFIWEILLYFFYFFLFNKKSLKILDTKFGYFNAWGTPYPYPISVPPKNIYPKKITVKELKTDICGLKGKNLTRHFPA